MFRNLIAILKEIYLMMRHRGMSFYSDYQKAEFLGKIIDFAKYTKLDGDYLEFGVAKGETFANIFRIAKSRGLNKMRFYAFDSFEGLPQPKGIDDDSGQFKQGQYACNLDNFRKNLINKGVDLNKVELIPGWFNEILNKELKNKLKIKSAAIIWIDCDLYESTVPVLDFIKDYLIDGTVLVFDDWYCFRGNPNKGEQKAFYEWLKRNPDIQVTEYNKFSWHGNSFIVNK